MTKLGRKAIYGDTCAMPNCNAPRHVLNSKGTPSRSRLCDRHYREDMAARYAARKTEQPTPATIPSGYTVAEAYQLWDGRSYAPELFYKRKQVFGMKLCAAGFTLVLEGEDAAQWVAGVTRLKVKP
jgi:hypothetical protein